MCALLDDEKAQDELKAQVKRKSSLALIEIALTALEKAATQLASSYSCALLRQVLLSGSTGLAAITKAEMNLRSRGEKVSLAESLVRLANDGVPEVLNFVNDALALCSTDANGNLQRFLQEIRTEVSVFMAEDIFSPLLGILSTEDRLAATLRLGSNADVRRQVNLAGMVASQAARESALHRQVNELNNRLDAERERLRMARIEIRRLGCALKEVAHFVELSPSSIADSVRTVLRCGWHGPVWRRQQTPLHMAAELGRTDLIPLFIALKGDPMAKDAKGRTPTDIAKKKGHTTFAAMLDDAVNNAQFNQEHNNGFFDDTGAFVLGGGCNRIRRCIARAKWLYKWLCKRRRAGEERDIEQGSGVELSGGMFSTEAAGEGTGLNALNEENVMRYRRMLNALGDKHVIKTLMAAPTLGGLCLKEEEVDVAMGIIMDKELPGASGAANAADASGVAAPSEGATKAGEGDGCALHGLAAKGKGKPCAPGKAGKAGKGPGVPGGRGLPTPAGKGGKDGSKKEAPSGRGQQLAKPVFKPPVRMKPLWWNRVLVDQIYEKTVWAHVPDYLERLLSTDFGTLFAQKNQNEPSGPKRAAAKKAEETKLLLRFITDQSDIFSKEVAFKALPKPAVIAEAVRRLDSFILTPEIAQVLIDHACPTDVQMQRMSEMMVANPGVPWALAESFMWAVGQVPMVRARLTCHRCLESYADSLGPVLRDLEKMNRACQDMRSSAVVRSFLGCVLALGNFLNGGTSRGQADGFDLETLGKLSLVKDIHGKDLRHFLCTQMLQGGVFQDVGEALFNDLANVTRLVKRRMTKSTDGAESVAKKTHGSVEDLEVSVRVIYKDFLQNVELFQACLQTGELDADDPLRMEMPERFEHAQDAFDKALALVEATKAEFKKVQGYFCSTSSSDDFLVLWDDVLLPPDILSLPSKKAVTPQLFIDNAVTYDDFVAIWDFTAKPKRAQTTYDTDERKPTQAPILKRAPGIDGCRPRAGAKSSEKVPRSRTVAIDDQAVPFIAAAHGDARENAERHVRGMSPAKADLGMLRRMQRTASMKRRVSRAFAPTGTALLADESQAQAMPLAACNSDGINSTSAPTVAHVPQDAHRDFMDRGMSRGTLVSEQLSSKASLQAPEQAPHLELPKEFLQQASLAHQEPERQGQSLCGWGIVKP
mmetsp:Transcript_76858/g.213520  ORF Transcript_76858/g.213520 Transcript_76858/m.213520 type:complete len:1164 (-) Transcript_76858:106-3597(-)